METTSLFHNIAIIGDAKVTIEIKSSEELKTRHKNGLKAFKEEHPDCRPILVSFDPITRPSGDIELIYVLDFLKMLWNGSWPSQWACPDRSVRNAVP